MDSRKLKVSLLVYIVIILSLSLFIVNPGLAQVSGQTPTPTPPPGSFVPDWRSINYDPFNLIPLAGINNPVLTGANVTDTNASFVADPFLFHEGSDWFLFFELFDVTINRGRIGVARSTDGLH